MGIYDRDYYQEEEPRSWGNQSAVITLIGINVIVYLIDLLVVDGAWTRPSSALVMTNEYFQRPWEVWRLVTYGFLHSYNQLPHIVLNMFGLWMFGTDVEAVYGRKSFFRAYFSFLILAGLIWAIGEVLLGLVKPRNPVPMFGASGAVTAIVIVFVMNFPNRTILMLGFLPTPAWVMGMLYIGTDLFQMVSIPEDKKEVAYMAHLGGALSGFIFYRTRLTLFSWVPDNLSWASIKKKFRNKPNLRVHRAEELSTDDLQEEVDRILQKISLSGESSLTDAERRTLEQASERYKKQRR